MMASSSFPRPANKHESGGEHNSNNNSAPNWVELPRDLTAKILHKLGAIEILTGAEQVCPVWLKICKDPLMRRTIDMSNFRTFYDDTYYLDIICRCAVDRSCGHLHYIHLESFATDDLLNYIADRSSHLRRIRLVCCSAISNQGLSEVAKKLPLLEELDISFCNISKESLEAIGRCCPLLKALTFKPYYTSIGCDDEVFAIAKTMPELHISSLGEASSLMLACLPFLMVALTLNLLICELVLILICKEV